MENSDTQNQIERNGDFPTGAAQPPVLKKNGNAYEHLKIRSFMMRVFALFFIAILTISVSNVHAFTNGNSEKGLAEGFYPFGKGILELQGPGQQCTFQMPNYSVKSINASKPIPLLDIIDFQHNFFAVLGNNVDNSYHYFQIGLPGGPGFPSYLLDVKKDGKQIRGGFYQDYENLAVLMESDIQKQALRDDSHKSYFEEDSKYVTSSLETFDPGKYNFEAILLKSDKSYWIKNEICAIYMNWPFVIEDDADITVESPTVDVGKLVDVTGKFSPLKQSKAGVNSESIECKSGLRLILQTVDDSGNNRPACVTPETKEKLIERSWIKSDNQDGITVNFSFCGADGFDPDGNPNKSNSTHTWNHNSCTWEQNPLVIEVCRGGCEE